MRDIGFADAAEFVAVYIDMDDLQFVVDAPGHLLVEPRADTENDIAVAPERVADRGADAQFAIARDDTAAGSVGDGRAGQNLRQPRHVFAAILGAAANDDERPPRRFEQACSGIDRFGVDLRRGLRRCSQAGRCAVHRRFPHVDRDFDPDRPAPAGPHRGKGGLQQGVGARAAGRS